MNSGEPVRNRFKALAGMLGIMTINAAFDWDRTVEGHLFWQRASARFVRWYCNG